MSQVNQQSPNYFNLLLNKNNDAIYKGAIIA